MVESDQRGGNTMVRKGKSLIKYDFPTKSEAEKIAKQFILPGHWRINKVKSGWRLHIIK